MTQEIANIEFIMWNFTADSRGVARDRVALALYSATFSESRAPQLGADVAFRRAADRLKNADRRTTVFAVESREESRILRCQVDNVRQENGRMIREEIGIYDCDLGLSTRSLAELRTVHETDPELTAQLREAFDLESRSYRAADLTRIIQNIAKLDGSGLYSPRDAGGVYFCPVSSGSTALLDQLEQFCRDVGVNLLRYRVPDTAAQREEVAAAIVAGLSGDVDAHRAAVDSYSAETRPGILDNRRSAIDATQTLTRRLESFIGAAWATTLCGSLAELRARMDAVDASRAVQSGPVARRIQIRPNVAAVA